MSIYWKVKSWTITITGAFPISARTFTQTAANESYLVCNNSGINGNGFSPNDETNNFFLNGFFVNSYSNPTFYGVVPNFLVKGSNELIYTSGGLIDFEREVGSFSFFGQSYPLYRSSEDDPNPPAASGVISPDSYWPYNP